MADRKIESAAAEPTAKLDELPAELPVEEPAQPEKGTKLVDAEVQAKLETSVAERVQLVDGAEIAVRAQGGLATFEVTDGITTVRAGRRIRLDDRSDAAVEKMASGWARDTIRTGMGEKVFRPERE